MNRRIGSRSQASRLCNRRRRGRADGRCRSQTTLRQRSAYLEALRFRNQPSHHVKVPSPIVAQKRVRTRVGQEEIGVAVVVVIAGGGADVVAVIATGETCG